MDGAATFEELNPKAFCGSPTGLAQGHAWWHVVSGGGLLLVYEFFGRGDRRVMSKPFE